MSSSSWLKISLGANALLAAFLIGALGRSPSPAPASSSPVLASAPSSAPGLAEKSPAPAPASWTDSLAELRRVGVPSAIIAKLVVEKVALKWTPIETELEQKYLHGDIDARRLAEHHDQRALEQEAELRAALGDAYLAWDREQTVANMYLGGHVPTEEQKEPIYGLQKEHLSRLRELEIAKRNGVIDDPAFETARARAELDFKTKLAAIIGEDRVDGLRQTDPAQQVRADFAQLGLSGAQMRELAEVNAKWSSTRADMARSLAETSALDSAYEGDLRALDRARDDEYRRILGDERLEAWQRAGDDRYRVMQENASAWNLDPAAITQVYSTLRAYDLAVANREYQAQLAEQAGETVDWAKVQTDIAAYSRDTEAALRARLGEERFARLSQTEIIALREPDLAKSALGDRPRL